MPVVVARAARFLLPFGLFVALSLVLAARAGADEPVATEPPAPVAEAPQGTPPAGADGPDNGQQATATTTGTAVADSGNNVATGEAAAVAEPNAPPVPAPTAGDATASTESGAGNATGSTGSTDVVQAASGDVTDQASVDILQAALVVNVGVGNATSGANAAIVGTGESESVGLPAVGGTTVVTGDAAATGNRGDTTVTQAAIVGSGDDSRQVATVLNVGVGLGNTGVNVAIATIAADGTPGAQAVTFDDSAGLVGITTGSADAVGNQADNSVRQSATGVASGTATLIIDQRALIVNFGVAFANTGANVAISGTGVDALTPEQQRAVGEVLAVLAAYLDGYSAAPSGASAVSAVIDTGNARAVGNHTTTSVAQTVTGEVHGAAQAAASQRAVVANMGLALANTGFNLSAAQVQRLVPVAEDLANFFARLHDFEWLVEGNPFAPFARTVELDGFTLELGGDIRGTEFLVGWDDALIPEGGPIAGGLRVRQITAVLDIGISVAETGRNIAAAIVTNEGHGGMLATLAEFGDAGARVATGTATAVGNETVVVVCQAYRDAAACAPPVAAPVPGPVPAVTPAAPPPQVAATPEAAQPVVAPAAAVDAPAAAEADDRVEVAAGNTGTLPLTGTSSAPWATIGVGMVGAGASLASRRRRAAR